MRFCKECGNKLEKNTLYCGECGTSVNSEKNQQQPVNQAAPSVPMKKKTKQIMLISAGLLIIAVSVVIFLLNNDDAKTATTQQIDQEVAPPEINEQLFNTLFPSWQEIAHENIKIGEADYTVLAIGKKDSTESAKVKVAVIAYEHQNEQWVNVWETEEYEGDPYVNVESLIGDMLIINPEAGSRALVAFNLMDSGNLPSYNTYVVEVNNQGVGNNAWVGRGSGIEVKDNAIVVYEKGETHVSLNDSGEVEINELTRSDLNTSGSGKAGFILEDTGLVVPTGDREIYIKVGQKVTFIPANEATKQKFDDGKIAIYTNLWNNHAPVSTSNANRLPEGNSVEFTEAATVEFILEYYDGGVSPDDLPVTFIVHVEGE